MTMSNINILFLYSSGVCGETTVHEMYDDAAALFI
jgi:hypothetical protein